MGFSRAGRRTCWRSCTRISSRRRSRSTSTRYNSSKRNNARVSARMRSARSSMRRAPCSLRPASNRRVSGPRSACTGSRCVPMLLKLSTNSSIRPANSQNTVDAAGVVEHRREHAGRDEDQIRERITRRDDAPHFAAVEAEEQHHQADVDGLRGQRHRDQRQQVRREQPGERMPAAAGEIDMAREHQHQRGHRARCGSRAARPP